MRKVLLLGLAVFAVAFIVGLQTPVTAQAATCVHTCSCTGTPVYCCTANGVTTCKLDKNRYCPQIVTC